ncbi:MAG: PAS domain-containing protein [Kangiellaceae bacterium]|jgi:PAS domain S-box-containing protein|nr:PAS domain-containing protein [Kangiellaceae bacterium]
MNWNTSIKVARQDFLTQPSDHQLKISKTFQQLNELDCLVVILNKTGEIVFINTYACKLLNVSFDEVIGKSWIERFIPDDQRDELSKSFTVMAKGITAPFDSYYNDVITYNNERISLHWKNTFIYDDRDNVIASFSIGSETSCFDHLPDIDLHSLMSSEC